MKKITSITLLLLTCLLIGAYFWMSQHPRTLHGPAHIIEGEEARSYLAEHDYLTIPAPAQPLRVLPIVVTNYETFDTARSIIFYAGAEWLLQFLNTHDNEKKQLGELAGLSMSNASRASYMYELAPHQHYQGKIRDKDLAFDLYYESESGYAVLSLHTAE